MNIRRKGDRIEDTKRLKKDDPSCGDTGDGYGAEVGYELDGGFARVTVYPSRFKYEYTCTHG